MSFPRLIRRSWFLGLIGVILLAACFCFVIPNVFVAFTSTLARGKLTAQLKNCAQLDLAFKQYFLDRASTGSTDHSMPTVSRLIKEGYFDQSLLDDLSKHSGIFFVYVPTESQSKNVSIQYFGADGTEQLSFGDNDLLNTTK